MNRTARPGGARGPNLRAVAMMALLAFGAGGLASGCTTNPATGGRMVSFISPQEEARIGAEQHRKLVPAMGGVISRRDVQRYVASVGHLLARTSEMPNLRFTFTVLNTDSVNAFALPGGYIYITRGILVHFTSEAQLAAVLGHEIGHVTARHSVSQMSTQTLLQGAVGVGSILAPSLQPVFGVANAGLGVLFLKFSRESINRRIHTWNVCNRVLIY